MPQYFEYVFAAYAIWFAAFAAYFGHLFLRTRRSARGLRALENLPGESEAGAKPR